MDDSARFIITPSPDGRLHIEQLCASIAAGDVLEVCRIAKLVRPHINAGFYGLDGGMTPLMHACRSLHLEGETRQEIAAILLREGADVNHLSRGGVVDGFTRVNALWLAARSKDGSTCQLLIDNGALLCPCIEEEAQFTLKVISEGFVKKYAPLFRFVGITPLPKDLQGVIFAFLQRLHLRPVNWT